MTSPDAERCLSDSDRAAIYVLADGSSVRKEFKQPKSAAAARRLDTLIAHGSSLLQTHAAWPVGRHGRQAVELPLVPGVPSSHLMYRRLRLKSFPGADWTLVVRAARSLAEACAAVNASGFFMPNLDEYNVLIDETGTARLVSCDGYVTALDGLSPTCSPDSIAYPPPELIGGGGGVRTADHDAYALAVILFKLLFQGCPPELVISPPPPPSGISLSARIAQTRAAQSLMAQGGRQATDDLALADLTPEVAALFERSLGSSRARPTASEWAVALRDMEARLRRCDKQPTHSYVSGGRGCPWCRLAKAGRDRDPFRPAEDGLSTRDAEDPGKVALSARLARSPPARPPSWRGVGLLALALVVLSLSVGPAKGLYQWLKTLKPPPPPPEVVVEPSPRQVEDEAWIEASRSPAPDGPISYITRYPGGRYQDSANSLLRAWGLGLPIAPTTAEWRASLPVRLWSAPHGMAARTVLVGPDDAIEALGTVSVFDVTWLVARVEGGDILFAPVAAFSMIEPARDAEPVVEADEARPAPKLQMPPPPRPQPRVREATPPRPPPVDPRSLSANKASPDSRLRNDPVRSNLDSQRSASDTPTLNTVAFKRWRERLQSRIARLGGDRRFGRNRGRTSVRLTVWADGSGKVVAAVPADGGQSELSDWMIGEVVGQRLFDPRQGGLPGKATLPAIPFDFQ